MAKTLTALRPTIIIRRKRLTLKLLESFSKIIKYIKSFIILSILLGLYYKGKINEQIL